jgi:hypothetical protein
MKELKCIGKSLSIPYYYKWKNTERHEIVIPAILRAQQNKDATSVVDTVYNQEQLNKMTKVQLNKVGTSLHIRRTRNIQKNTLISMILINQEVEQSDKWTENKLTRRTLRELREIAAKNDIVIPANNKTKKQIIAFLLPILQTLQSQIEPVSSPIQPVPSPVQPVPSPVQPVPSPVQPVPSPVEEPTIDKCLEILSQDPNSIEILYNTLIVSLMSLPTASRINYLKDISSSLAQVISQMPSSEVNNIVRPFENIILEEKEYTPPNLPRSIEIEIPEEEVVINTEQVIPITPSRAQVIKKSDVVNILPLIEDENREYSLDDMRVQTAEAINLLLLSTE